MPKSLIDQALQTATDTSAITVGRGVVTATGRLFVEQFPGRAGVIFADDSHWKVAGRAVIQSLTTAGVALDDPYVFPAEPTLYANYDNVEVVRERLRGTDAIPIAIASGTLNDIVKRACGELGRPYLCVATAASQDGYAAYGASITKDDFKQTMTCPAPVAIVADVDIMAAAPSRLTASGFGDLADKIPGGADWIICDELGIEKIDPYVWDLVQGPLRGSLGDPQGCKDGNPDAVAALAEGLLMSGLAMQAYQSSRPGSGGGHHFSHLWEMDHYGLDWEPPLSHGFKVGLGALAMTALYEVVLTNDVVSLIDVDAAVAAWPTWEQTEAYVRQAIMPDLQEPALAQTRDKYLQPDELRARLELVIERWPEIEKRVGEQLLPASVLKEKLETVGAVAHPSQMEMPMDQFRDTYYRARWIRSRYVLTDLLTQANLFDQFVDELFAEGGFWSE